MGNLGFLFELKEMDLVVFTKSNKFKGELILGFKNFRQDFEKNGGKFKFLSKDLKLKNFLVLKNTKFKSSKISLSTKKVLDYEFLTFWFGTKAYKEIRDLFEFNLSTKYNDDEIVRKVLDLIEHF